MEREQDENQPASKPGSSAPAQGFTPYVALLGDYELRRIIGRGGMGTVYEAWQRSLHRIVALKVLAGHIGESAKAIQRFEREAQAAAKLHHTHIVPIFARGEENGTYYYAMELVSGRSLNAIIAEARERRLADTATVDLAETLPLPHAQAQGKSGAKDTTASDAAVEDPGTTPITLDGYAVDGDSVEHFDAIARHMASIADALDYAHRQGVVHRDVKPHNLILGDDGRMRITDFGLARVAEQPGVTLTGEVVGSPLYMAPEQFSGSPGTVDQRADIYSLGATMYEWLILQPPHFGETREAVISKILSGDPLPLRAQNPSVPIDLETVCLKAMARDPAKRYTSGAELREDLHRYLQNRKIKAKRAGLLERARKFVNRHQVASISTVGLVVALALVWALYMKQTQVVTKTAAVDKIQHDAEEITNDRDYLLHLFAKAVPLPGAEAAGTMIGDIVGKGQIMSFGTGSSDVKGANPQAVSTPQGIAQRTTIDLYDALARDATEEGSPDRIGRGDPSRSRSESGFGQGSFGDQANEGDDGCAFAMRAALEKRPSDPSEALGLVNLCLSNRTDHGPALQLRTALHGQLGDYEKMLADAERLIQLDVDPSAGFMWRAVAWLLLNQPERCLEDIRRVVEPGAWTVWLTFLHGLALLQLDRPAEALKALDEALTTAPDLVVGLLARARARRTMGDVEPAVEDLSRVLELESRNADVLAARGECHMELGDFGSAADDFRGAMDIAGETPPMIMLFFQAKSRQVNLQRTVPDQPDVKEEVEPVRPSEETSDRPLWDWFSRLLKPRAGQESKQDRTPSTVRPGTRNRASMIP